MHTFSHTTRRTLKKGPAPAAAATRKRAHLIAAVGLAAASLFGTAGPAAAATPQIVRIPVHSERSFDDCGFVVDVVRTGTFSATVWHNAAGLAVQERDVYSSLHRTFTNEETGKSVSDVVSQSLAFDYGSGAVVGSSVEITLTGMESNVPGFGGPSTGRVVLPGTVVGFDPQFGLPLIDAPDQDPLFLAGRQPDQDICAALS
jgi:hypothetical protein